MNAWVAETERNPGLLPVEFRLLGIRPGRWTPEVVVSRHQGLVANVDDEIDYARAVAAVGADAVRELEGFGPGRPELDLAVDPEALTDDILDLYQASRRSLRFRPEDVVPEHRGDDEGLALLNRLADELSIPARILVPLLDHVEAEPGPVEEARRWLLDWDFVLDAESVAGGIYVAWEGAVRGRVADLAVPEGGREHLGWPPLSAVIGWVLAPDGRFGGDPVRARDRLLLAALEDAVDELTGKLGPEMDGWQWGQEAYHHALLRHPLSGAVDAATRELLEIGPAPRGGYGYTVNQTGSGDNQGGGASFRIVVDVGAWDRSVGMNTPGQGGDPADPHYRDLFDLWAADRFHPMPYSREAVESVADRRTRLLPGG